MNSLIRQAILLLLLSVLVLCMGACTSQEERPQSASDVRPCSIIYDAGSKRTRLYIYQQTAAGWVKHRGPKTSALADPVRGIRGKSMADAHSVVEEVIAALENIRRDGPLNKKGVPQWPAFDWQRECSTGDVSVYATAGMRLAQQQDAGSSAVLWKMLKDRLSATVGMPVTARTLSGYEEGLFAWLAKREEEADGRFGVAEMGGASIQVTFPCADCDTTRPVKVKGEIEHIYSHSFLGWGQDEAWKNFGSSPACARGAGKDNPDWRMADCAVGMSAFSNVAAKIENFVSAEHGLRWYLSDAFRYMHSSDIDEFCRQGKNSGFEPVSSCFRAVYLQNVIGSLGLPADSQTTDINWTLGAVVCTSTGCLDTQ